MNHNSRANWIAILFFLGLFIFLQGMAQNATTWASPNSQGATPTVQNYLPVILKDFPLATSTPSPTLTSTPTSTPTPTSTHTPTITPTPTRTPIVNALSPNGLVSDWESGRNHLFISSRDANAVVVRDEITQNTLATIPVGSQPFGIAIANNQVFVANYGSGSVSVINPASLIKITDINLNANGCAGNPANLAVDTFSNHVFVALYGIGRVAKIDATTNTMVECIATNSQGTFGVAVHQVFGHLYVTNRDGKNLQVYDVNSTPSTKVGPDIDVGGVPFFVQWSQITSDVYVMVAADFPNYATANQLKAYNTATTGVTFSRSATIGNTEDGGAIWASGGSSALYIAATADNKVQIVDSTTLAVSSFYSMTDPFAITENPALGNTYIANRAANLITTLPNNLARPKK